MEGFAEVFGARECGASVRESRCCDADFVAGAADVPSDHTSMRLDVGVVVGGHARAGRREATALCAECVRCVGTEKQKQAKGSGEGDTSAHLDSHFAADDFMWAFGGAVFGDGLARTREVATEVSVHAKRRELWAYEVVCESCVVGMCLCA